MKKLDLLLYNINKFNEKYGFEHNPTMTVGYDFWRDCIKEFNNRILYTYPTNIIEGDYFMFSGCKCVWSHAIKGDIIITGIQL